MTRTCSWRCPWRRTAVWWSCSGTEDGCWWRAASPGPPGTPIRRGTVSASLVWTRGRHFWANRVAIFVGRQRQAARLGDHSVGASKTCLCLHYFCFTHTTLYPVGFFSVNSTRRFHFCCRKYCPELPSCHYIWHFDNGSIFVFIFFREFCQSYRRYVLVCSKQKVFDFFLLVLSSIIL